MYLVYQYGKENPLALCLTKTSANDIIKYLNDGDHAQAWYEKMEPVDLDQFVKQKEEVK